MRIVISALLLWMVAAGSALAAGGGGGGPGMGSIGSAPAARSPDEPGQTTAFRVPTLRNVAVTAPYMHDGSMQSLPEVLDHYATGGRFRGAQTDHRLRVIVPFTAQEPVDLVEFLDALTDGQFVSAR